MKHYRFLSEALLEYEAAVEYYERAQAGLGEAFMRAVERAIELTLELPKMGSLVTTTPRELEIRRRLIRKFGVELDYTIRDETLLVLAIFHGKRRPGYWIERLEQLR